MKRLVKLTAIFEEVDGQYSVEFPAAPGAITFGNSVTEAIEMAKECLALHFSDPEDEIPVEDLSGIELTQNQQFVPIATVTFDESEVNLNKQLILVKEDEIELVKYNFRKINMDNCTLCNHFIHYSKNNYGCKKFKYCTDISVNTVCDLYKEG